MSMMSPATASAYSITQYGTPPQARAPTPAQWGSTRERIHEAAKEFESVFLAQMLKPMFNTVDVDENFGGGAAEETWRGILVEKYADEITKAGGIGLAKVIEEQMLKLQEIKDGHTTAATTQTPESTAATVGAENQTPATGKALSEQSPVEPLTRSAETLAPRRTGSLSAGYAGSSGGGTGHETTHSFIV